MAHGASSKHNLTPMYCQYTIKLENKLVGLTMRSRIYSFLPVIHHMYNSFFYQAKNDFIDAINSSRKKRERKSTEKYYFIFKVECSIKMIIHIHIFAYSLLLFIIHYIYMFLYTAL